jgi:hypothetical protein
MLNNDEMLLVLRHDLHKIRVAGAPAHKDALLDKCAQQADGFAAWMSRNFLKEPFDDTLYRKSLIFQATNLKNPRALVSQHRTEMTELFKEAEAATLHTLILQSKLLNLYCEARQFPYTSLKYHILLTCALYYNLKGGLSCPNCIYVRIFPLRALFKYSIRIEPVPGPCSPIAKRQDSLKSIPRFI